MPARGLVTMLDYLKSTSLKGIALIYAVASVICCGIGMGIPVLNILLGFPAGWLAAEREFLSAGRGGVMGRILVQSLVAAAFTMALMCIVWGFMVRMAFDPAADLKNFGIPMILYSPKPSFVGWFVLMVVISPALQLLVMVFTAFLVMVRRERSGMPREVPER